MPRSFLTIRPEGDPRGGLTIEVVDFRYTIARAAWSVPGDVSRRAASIPDRGTLSFDLVWDHAPDFPAWLAAVDARREFGRLLAALRVRPGAAFAGLMEPTRN